MIKKIIKRVNQKPLKLRFQRFEFKYRLPEYIVGKIIQDLLNHMDWDPYVAGNNDKSYQVSSLYFDTTGFGCYHEKIAGVKSRKKLRLRTYATELQPDTRVFLEIKRKNDMIVFKDRLATNYQECFHSINNGQFSRLVDHASCQDKELLKEFLWLKEYNCLLPKLMVIYKRQPLVGRIDQKFRVTFDSQLKAYPANQLFFSKRAVEVFPHSVIMELKYNDSVPYWFHQIIKKYQLNREPFSKYCQSLEASQKYYHYV